MKHVSTEIMNVVCDKCGSTHSTGDMKDFKESNTYPPFAHFMCLGCQQVATVSAAEMPKRLFAHLVAKITKERFGDLETRMFSQLTDI